MGGLHRLLGGDQLSVLCSCLVALSLQQSIVSSGLITQQAALLKLRLHLEELFLKDISLAAATMQLSLGLLQLRLALLEFSGELLLGGAHGGGDLLRDFEELTSILLHRLHVKGTERESKGKATVFLGLFKTKSQKTEVCI